MRIFFIPGFGEKPNAFDKIAPHIAGDKVFIDCWEEIGDTPRKDINVLKLANELVNKYSITPDDVIIGHSMGGWIAYHTKHVTGCRIIQVASWTKPDRVITPIQNRKIIYWFMRSGLALNRLSLRFMVWKFYRHKPSKDIFAETFGSLVFGNKGNVVNQMRVILEPVTETITVQPDLRIHAKRDNIIRYPKGEECCTVSGDHFTLVTHPEEVYGPINDFLTSPVLPAAIHPLREGDI